MSFVDKTTGETLTGPIEDYRIVNKLSDEDDLLELCENYMSIIEGVYSEWIDVIKFQLEKHIKNSGA